MSLPAPKPLSVSKSPSRGPAEARVAVQDAQIAQLVQQNRTLEHTLAQLRTQLKEEEARGIDAVNQMREKWKAERKEWQDGCDSLQAKHRLAHLGTRVALEHERSLRLEDRETLIREKTATMLREYKITLFQARETELVAQVAALEVCILRSSARATFARLGLMFLMNRMRYNRSVKKWLIFHHNTRQSSHV